MTISLGRNLRSVVHNVRQSQRSFDRLQTRLASGKSVNRPIDNPSSFFTAKTLNERSIKLGRIMDNMGQAVNTVKAASEALEAAIGLIDHANAIAEQAVEATKKSPESVLTEAGVDFYAVVRTEAELIDAVANAAAGQFIVIDGEIDMSENNSLTLKDGQKLVGTGHFEDLSSHFADETGSQKARLNFSGTDINGINAADNNTISNIDITLKLDTATTRRGAIAAVSVSNLKISDVGIESNTEAGDHNKAAHGLFLEKSEVELSNDIYIKTVGVRSRGIDIASGKTVDLKAANVAINVSGTGSEGVYQTGVLTVDGSSKLNAVSSSRAYTLHDKLDLKSGAEVYLTSASTFALNGGAGSSYNFESNSTFVAHTEGSSHATRRLLKCDYEAGAIIGLQSDGLGLGGTWEVNTTHSTVAGTTDKSTLSGAEYTLISDSLPAYKKAEVEIPDYNDIGFDEDLKLPLLRGEYNTLISQYDQLINDADYRGKNLTKGDELEVSFNSSGTTSTTIKGRDVSHTEFGLHTLDSNDWAYTDDVMEDLHTLRNAKKTLRSVDENLSVGLNVIKSRQDFSKNMKDVLTVGADKLELADMNEESAKTLSIQTAVNLGMRCLSFATQHDRSILNAFQ